MLFPNFSKRIGEISYALNFKSGLLVILEVVNIHPCWSELCSYRCTGIIQYLLDMLAFYSQFFTSYVVHAIL